MPKTWLLFSGDCCGTPHVISANRGDIWLQPGSWSVDALEFARLAESSTFDDLKRAIELYRGEVLDSRACLVGAHGRSEGLLDRAQG